MHLRVVGAVVPRHGGEPSDEHPSGHQPITCGRRASHGGERTAACS
eukprot:COSAG01_NODE_25931_length_728_cov_35.017488_2_plen_45_part_01